MILEIKNVSKTYKKPFSREKFLAVKNASFALRKGRTIGILGESGSGKTTLAKLILRLEKPDSGEILFHGKSVHALKGKSLKEFYQKVQMVFQEPYASLDPRFKIKDILKEPFRIAGETNMSLLDKKVEELLKAVGLNPAFAERRSTQLSGGECQRVAIARAVSTNPEIIICDEPVSSLDAIVQAQILNLFLKLQKEKHISYIFISHDRRVIRHMSDEILSMEDSEISPCQELSKSL